MVISDLLVLEGLVLCLAMVQCPRRVVELCKTPAPRAVSIIVIGRIHDGGDAPSLRPSIPY